MTIMTKEQVGAWCKEIADQINSDPILLDVFTRAYCTEGEEHMTKHDDMETKEKRDELERTFSAASDTRNACKAAYLNDPTDEAWDAVMVADELYNVARCNRDVARGYAGVM